IARTSGRQHDVAIGAVALRRGAVHQRSGRRGRSAASRPSEIWLTRCEHRAICASPLGFLPPCGAVAQLGERWNGIQEVEGSTPFGSTCHSTCYTPPTQPRTPTVGVLSVFSSSPARSGTTLARSP